MQQSAVSASLPLLRRIFRQMLMVSPSVCLQPDPKVARNPWRNVERDQN